MEYGFVRINKSIIVNIHHIEHIIPDINYRYCLYMSDNNVLILNRSYVKMFKAKLKGKEASETVRNIIVEYHLRLAKYLGVSRQMLYNYLGIDDINNWPKEKAAKLLSLLNTILTVYVILVLRSNIIMDLSLMVL